jgi:RNA polymerase sigma-70 factor (ECF subfamily)
MTAGRGPTQISTELIASAQLGNHAAISTLLAVAQPDIRRYARINCKVGDIDDAVQDTLWVLYRKIGALRVVTSFSAWLFEIVRRECMRLARRALASALPIEDAQHEPALASRPELDLRLDLADAIQSLPEHYRVIVLMRDVEELTISEIAASLQITRETVKARLHRARKLIREYIMQ